MKFSLWLLRRLLEIWSGLVCTSSMLRRSGLSNINQGTKPFAHILKFYFLVKVLLSDFIKEENKPWNSLKISVLLKSTLVCWVPLRFTFETIVVQHLNNQGVHKIWRCNSDEVFMGAKITGENYRRQLFHLKFVQVRDIKKWRISL